MAAEEREMRRRVTRWFTVSTDRGTGLYRTFAHAMSAAKWMARESGRPVDLASDGTGETWRVLPPVGVSSG
jgi:hypothetical protein